MPAQGKGGEQTLTDDPLPAKKQPYVFNIYSGPTTTNTEKTVELPLTDDPIPSKTAPYLVQSTVRYYIQVYFSIFYASTTLAYVTIECPTPS